MPPSVPKEIVSYWVQKGKSQEVIKVEKKKMGRPTDSPKDTMLRIRIDSETVEKLGVIATKTGKSKSEIVRDGIDEQYNKIK